MTELAGTVLEELDLPPNKVDEPGPIFELPADLNPTDFGGDRFDASGNLIKENKIFKSKEAIAEEYKLKNPKVDDVEKPNGDDVPKDDEYSLDKDGNLVKSDGTIYKNKGEFEIDKEGNVTLKEASFINELIEVAKTQGYDFLDEEGNPVEFEDSQDGYFKVAEYIGEHKAIGFITDMLGSNPELKNFYDHIQAGKNPMEFYRNRVEQKDYTTTNLKDNELGQELVLIDKYTKINKMDETNAKEFIALIKSTGKLEEKSKEALVELQNWQKELTEKEQLDNQAKIQADLKAQVKAVNEIKEVVNKGEVGNIVIPTTKRKEFIDYLTKEVAPGATQSGVDFNQLPLNQKLMLEYMLFTKLDLNELVKIQVAKEKADLIKDRAKLSKPIKITNAANFGNRATTVPDLDQIQ